MIQRKDSIITSAIITNAVFILFSLACILPVILLLSISISDSNSIYEYGFSFIPAKFSLKAYWYILKDSKQLFASYGVSLFVTIVGGILSLIVISMLAYPLSRKDFKFNKGLSFYVFFTMLFNGGLVPWYILIVKYLHLKDKIWVLILPYLVLGWYVLLMRSFFSSIPMEIIEAANIDGSSEFRTYYNIILPMSKPALATIGLLSVLRYWNDWWLGMLFIQKNTLIPLQYLLYRIMSNAEELARTASLILDASNEEFPTEPARMAMAVLAAGPMLFVFPFFQKYFVKGLTVGGVKG